MTEQGYIKLFRSLTKWEWYQDANTMRVWLHLLLNANWQDARWQGIEVKAGSLITTYQKLSDELQISKQAVRTALEHLKSTRELTLQSTRKAMLITVEKWAFFQGDNVESNTMINTMINTQVTRNQHASNTQVIPIEEIKNNKNNKNIINAHAGACADACVNNKENNNPVVSDRLNGQLTSMQNQTKIISNELVISDRLAEKLRGFKQ